MSHTSKNPPDVFSTPSGKPMTAIQAMDHVVNHYTGKRLGTLGRIRRAGHASRSQAEGWFGVSKTRKQATAERKSILEGGKYHGWDEQRSKERRRMAAHSKRKRQ